MEVLEIHFNEILDLRDDKDGRSVFQMCHLPFLPALLLLLLFQPFCNELVLDRDHLRFKE